MNLRLLQDTLNEVFDSPSPLASLDVDGNLRVLFSTKPQAYLATVPPDAFDLILSTPEQIRRWCETRKELMQRHAERIQTTTVQ